MEEDKERVRVLKEDLLEEAQRELIRVGVLTISHNATQNHILLINCWLRQELFT